MSQADATNYGTKFAIFPAARSHLPPSFPGLCVVVVVAVALPARRPSYTLTEEALPPPPMTAAAWTQGLAGSLACCGKRMCRSLAVIRALVCGGGAQFLAWVPPRCRSCVEFCPLPAAPDDAGLRPRALTRSLTLTNTSVVYTHTHHGIKLVVSCWPPHDFPIQNISHSEIWLCHPNNKPIVCSAYCAQTQLNIYCHRFFA